MVEYFAHVALFADDAQVNTVRCRSSLKTIVE